MGASISFWKSFFENFSTASSGFIFMWIILIMLIISLAIAIERTYYIMVRSNVNADKFMMEIRKLEINFYDRFSSTNQIIYRDEMERQTTEFKY